MIKYYLIKELTNKQKQDGSSISVYSIADFSESKAYDVGDVCYHASQKYECVNAHTGEWVDEDFVPTDKDPALNSAVVVYHQTLSFHNADDVLYAVVQIQDDYGRTVGGDNGYIEIVDHRDA